MKQNQKDLLPMDATQTSALCSEGLAQSSVEIWISKGFGLGID